MFYVRYSNLTNVCFFSDLPTNSPSISEVELKVTLTQISSKQCCCPGKFRLSLFKDRNVTDVTASLYQTLWISFHSLTEFALTQQLSLIMSTAAEIIFNLQFTEEGKVAGNKKKGKSNPSNGSFQINYVCWNLFGNQQCSSEAAQRTSGFKGSELKRRLQLLHMSSPCNISLPHATFECPYSPTVRYLVINSPNNTCYVARTVPHAVVNQSIIRCLSILNFIQMKTIV